MGCDTPVGETGEWLLCPKCKRVSAHPSATVSADPTGDDSLFQMLPIRCFHCDWTSDANND